MNKNTNSNTSVTIGGDADMQESVIAGRDGVLSTTTERAGFLSAPPRSVPELRSALADLLDRIERHQDKLDDRHLIVETTRQALAEAGKEQPNRLALTGFLHAIGQSVAGIVHLAAIVSALELAVKTIFA